jgi:hypothetical protein
LEYKELETLEKIESKISLARNALENIFPIWNAIDRKRRDLEAQIKILCDERDALRQGQMNFNDNF